MTDHAYPYALPAGTDISGYVIDSVLGAGGFGITYRATNPVTGVTVAIKEFFPQGLATRQGAQVVLHADVSSGSYETALRKFEQEAAKLTGRFSHPTIVRGVNFLKANNTAYFVMEFIEGVSLDVWLAQRQTPPDEVELRHLFEPIFDAVNYIHTFDAMHRDLTPRNIMVRPDGTPMLVDFGASGEGLDVERPYSTAFAQPNYAPPEQIAHDDGRMQGRHTDIFSLAGVLYRAAAGQPPVRPLKRAQEVHILGDEADPYVPLSQAAIYPHAYSPNFFHGIDIALRLDYRQRPSSIADFRDALGWWQDGGVTEMTRPMGYDQRHHVTASDEATSRIPSYELRVDARSPRPTAGDDDERPAGTSSLLKKGLIAAALLVGVAFAGTALWVALEPAPPTTASNQPAPPPATPPATPALRPSSDPATPAGVTGPATPAVSPPVQPATPAVTPMPLPSVKPPAPSVAVKPPEPAAPTPTIDASFSEFTGYVPTGSVIQFVAGVEPPRPDQCRAACKDDRSCVAYSVDKNQCAMFTSVTGMSLVPGARAGAKAGLSSAAALKGAVDRADQRRGSFRTLDGFAINALGSSLLSTPRGIDTDAACAFACSSNASCKASDFNTETRACKLLRDVPVDAVAPAIGHVISMEDGDGTLGEAMRRASVPKPRVMEEFADVDLGGDVIAREPVLDAPTCRNVCLADQSCLATLYADQLCTRFSSVRDMEPRPGSTTFADSRNLALIQRLRTMPTLSAGIGPFQPGGMSPQVGPTPIGPNMPVTNPPVLGQGPMTLPSPTGPGATFPGTPPQQPGGPQPHNQAVLTPGALSDAETFTGFDLIGPGLNSDLARQARFPEACEMACQDTQSCVGYGFNAAENRCRLYSGVADITPNPSISSGIFRGPGQTAIDNARRRLGIAEANRANYRPMPNGCTPTGPSTSITLGTQGTAEQCAFQCRSLTNCQAYVYGPRDRSCQIFTGIAGVVGGVEAVSGVLDPTGRRVREMARDCGPIPPAAIGGEPGVPGAPREGNKPLFRLPW